MLKLKFMKMALFILLSYAHCFITWNLRSSPLVCLTFFVNVRLPRRGFFLPWRRRHYDVSKRR